MNRMPAHTGHAVRRGISLMLAACCAFSLITPRAFAYRYGGNAWGDDYYADGERIRGDSWYWRDSYRWHDDFLRDVRRMGAVRYYTSRNVDADGVVIRGEITSQMRSAAQNAGGQEAFVRTVNAETVSRQTLRALHDAAAGRGKTAVLMADTMLPSNNTYQTRLYLHPEQFYDSPEDIRLGVYSDNEWIYEAKQEYLERFQNHIELIRFAQRDSFPARVQVSAVIDLGKLDTQNLMLYSLNRATGRYSLLEDADSFIASSGRFVFFTRQAGDILITDRPLEERERF